MASTRILAVSFFALVIIGCGSAGTHTASRTPPVDCKPEHIDSLWLAAGPVYSSCEVDSVARLVSPPRVSPPSFAYPCFIATVLFVADTLGHVEPATLQL